ncbi:unnamed protein product [Blepharisma stoltei]|uniref:EF-hand domain-containing protein n=1 Tax=Blepharisma stoltei TaxID=1481888 RepID=A0AAU9J9G5_9CILI|nr:unnamed protein product [Blepharisma stoltei]
MGCACSSRDDDSKLNSEEKFIKAAEEILGIGKLKVAWYDKGISRFAIDQELSEKNFKHAYESLNLSTDFLNDDNSPLFRFYEHFKLMKGYEIRKLACLGIWLGTDDWKKKAYWLFKNYDRDCSNKLDLLEIRYMLDDMIKLTLAIVEFTQFVYPQKSIMLQKYLRKIRRSKVMLKKYLVVLIFRGGTVHEISLIDFLECFEDSTVKKLISDQGFRELLMECGELQTQSDLIYS